MACGNGSDRTQHPEELFGADWAEWVPPTEGGAEVEMARQPLTVTAEWPQAPVRTGH